MKIIISIWLAFLFLSVQGKKDSTSTKAPDALKIQYAGGMGLVSAGVTYDRWVKNIDFDIMLGYVPSRYTGDDSWQILTFRGTWTALEYQYKEFQVRPLRMGIHLNYTFDDDFFFDSDTDERYVNNYYWWSSAMRVNAFLGAEIEWRERVSLFMDAGTNDLYVWTYFANENSSVIPLWEIIVLDIGLKWNLRGDP